MKSLILILNIIKYVVLYYFALVALDKFKLFDNINVILLSIVFYAFVFISVFKFQDKIDDNRKE